MRNKSVTICVTVLILVTTSISKATLQGYVSTETAVIRTDFDTGQQTPLGQSGISDIRALDTSPINGTLYAVSHNGQLWTVDTATGLGSFVGNTGIRTDSLSFAPDGTLYAIDRNTYTLKIINTGTAASTTIGSAWSYDGMALAIDNTGRAVAWDYTNWDFFEINLTNASTSLLGHIDIPFSGLDYAPDNVLYGLWGRELYRVDPDSLQTAYLRDIDISAYYNDHASLAIVPEPATLFLLGLGAVILSGLRRKRS